MKIFGIGANRTGTASLTEILETLGFKTSHWDHHHEIAQNLINNVFHFDFLNEYDAVTDLPIPSIYKYLDKAYPNSKFILTKRDPNEWIKSIENHIKGGDGLETPIFEYFLMYGDFYYNKELFLEKYIEHNKSVENYFLNRPNDLLVIDLTVNNEWDPICGFLGVDIPAKKFPHKNKTQNYNLGWKVKRKLGLH